MKSKLIFLLLLVLGSTTMNAQFLKKIKDIARGTAERKVEQKTDDMDRQIINVFVRNIRSGGDAAEALQGAYGLSRAGR